MACRVNGVAVGGADTDVKGTDCALNIQTLKGSFIQVISPSPGSCAKISTVEQLIKQNHDDIMNRLNTDGALLFRGYDVETARDFERIGLAVLPLATRYPGGAPRVKHSEHVWSASETPAQMPISSHCELSYIPKLRPQAILFCCLNVPDEGGETPIANMHDVWASLPKDLRDRILANDFEVVRQYPGSKRRMLDVRRLAGPATAWSDVLGSSDPRTVQAEAEADGVTLNFWKSGATLPCMSSHEGSALQAVILGMFSVLMSPLIALMRMFSPWPLVEMQEKLPKCGDAGDSSVCVELVTHFSGSRQVAGRTAYAGVDVFFSEYGWAVEALFVAMHTRRLVHAYIALRIVIGTVLFTFLRKVGLIGRAPLDIMLQGRSLAISDVMHINQAYWKNFEFLKWQRGDVLILNNELCSHGRMPFEGPRKVLTAFG